MTVSSSTSKAGPYACNGATTAFAFAFYTLATTDIAVVRTDASSADTPLVNGADFTVVLNADQTTSPGGTVTLASAPASGNQITILRSLALTQSASIPNQGGWYPKVVENALDKLTMGLQQVAEKVSRAVVLGVTQSDPTALINTITANATSAAASASSATASATAASSSATAAAASAASAASASRGFKLAPIAGGILTQPNCYYTFMANAAYVLPDFTGFDNFGLASLANSPAVPTSVATSDGWSIAPGLVAGTFKAVAPMSSATPHGTWGAVAMTPPVLGSFTASAAPTLIGSAQLSASLVVLMYIVSGGTQVFVVAFNPVTGAFGTPVSLGTSLLGAGHIYADSATTFVVGFDASAAATVVAGSVSSLAIALGTPIPGSYGYQHLIQLAAGVYVHNSNNANCEAFTVAGTFVAKGAFASSGLGLSGANLIARVSANTFLMTGVSTGTPPAKLQAVVGTLTGNSIAFSAIASAATSILATSSSALFLRPLASGGPFIACMQNNSPSTTGVFYGITVSGTTANIGAALPLANTLPAISIPTTFISPPASNSAQAVMPYSASQLLVGYASGAIALSISGTTLTNGAVFGSASTKFAADAATGANAYAITSAAIDKVTVSAATISSSYQLAVSPAFVASDTLNDKSVNYGGAWYAWALPTMLCAITPNKWLSISGSTVTVYGPMA